MGAAADLECAAAHRIEAKDADLDRLPLAASDSSGADREVTGAKDLAEPALLVVVDDDLDVPEFADEEPGLRGNVDGDRRGDAIVGIPVLGGDRQGVGGGDPA